MNELMYYILLAVYGIFFIVVGGLCLADYILSALGLMRLARRRGIPNPWLSWIPVANIWLAGSLVDEYDLRQGKITRWRTALTALMALTLVLIVLYIVELLKMAIIADDTYYAENLGLALRALVIAIAMAGASTATKGCTMVCLYKVYESTVPEKALKYFTFVQARVTTAPRKTMKKLWLKSLKSHPKQPKNFQLKTNKNAKGKCPWLFN